MRGKKTIVGQRVGSPHIPRLNKSFFGGDEGAAAKRLYLTLRWFLIMFFLHLHLKDLFILFGSAIYCMFGSSMFTCQNHSTNNKATQLV